MGMISYVLGIIDPDDKWEKMKTVYDSCIDAGVEPPDEVLDFFNSEPPDPKGVVITLKESEGVSKYKDDMREGFEVDLSEIPKQITTIRFVNSY